jgi:ABC-2 type transport system permease protein
MSTSTSPSSASLPPRRLSAANQLQTLYTAQLRQLLTSRKAIALLIIQLLPALCALVYALVQDTDGLIMFRAVVERINFPFLIPMAALFFGGPVIVDEMEGRTLTYLTLRPLSKPVLYMGKLLAGITVSSLLSLISILALFLACLVASKDLASTASTLIQLGGVAILGTAAYTTIFAMLGALFASSIISGIIYFVVFEIVLAALPILELLSVRYYLRSSAGFNASDRLGALDQLILDKPLILDWWLGLLITLVLTVLCAGLGAFIFKDRQYHV